MGEREIEREKKGERRGEIEREKGREKRGERERGGGREHSRSISFTVQSEIDFQKPPLTWVSSFRKREF